MASLLATSSDTLSPLPSSHRDGLIAVTVFGFLSFIATTTLFIYLTFKLIRWHLQKPAARIQTERPQVQTTDLSLGLSQSHFAQSKADTDAAAQPDVTVISTERHVPHLNQFLLLVYNLLFAEMHQSTAFLLNVSWTTSNGVWVGTPACWAQGWFISTGDLAASVFITAIAVHTYLTVVKGYQPPQRLLLATIAFLWFFVYALGILGVLITNNGRDAGGLYVRAVAWCWMNVKYEKLRLWLHYFWIFLSLGLTSGIYILIFLSLRRDSTHRSSDNREQGRRQPNNSTGRAAGSHPGFLVYPIIYALCTAPLALFRVATMSGRDVSVGMFCFAAAMIASNGWLDVLLFSWTRSSIIFAPSPDAMDTGLDTFAFMRTPHTRRFGNMVWVQGGSRGESNDRGGGWWRIGGERTHQRAKSKSNRWPGGLGSVSQESLRGAANNEIQMDTVTSVVVEIDIANKEQAQSAHSSEKGFETSSTKYRLDS
ncbi:hypothetical protein PFICI_02107 [Pestalotiopsis fici W106-1]|uniref:Uncharacterized protein n=1 Tax=Pestalotiopsis fici (strain W106-1 / CGMCC3.15140) TaxID=1229662 RepID=W3XQL2_PESFW|nr:uncharacterized protein PFICI_02107 [Pestalotiopsis fici W106-1]ETS88279.1 hypothetical protein PFICI_02107 [Pestalotiopsis fici W106-1]